MTESALRNLPSIDLLLRKESLQPLIAEAGRDAVRDRLREVMAGLREEIIGDSSAGNCELEAVIEQRLMSSLTHRSMKLTQRVINATGVVLHTNLGRAPLSAEAIEAITRVARGYCNLEYDLATGKRGKRGTGFEDMLRDLLNCEAVAVVNNCAAAVLLTLNTLGEGGEVIVSRGELMEIGGSFRIPDVIAKSGARIREVGTTNRTRLSDYENAITEQTRVILRAHPSNYRIVGFTEKPSLEELSDLASRHNLPLFEDLGSGCMVNLLPLGITDEPTISYSIRSGCSVVAFSGDKLLGGPQSGIITGKTELIDRIRKNPLMRALRVDKLTYAALEATIAEYAAGRAMKTLPGLRSLFATKESITERAQAFIQRAKSSNGGAHLEVIDGFSVVGGGSAPESQIPTSLISIVIGEMTAEQIEEKLRLGNPPVIARIIDDKLTLDLRTVAPDEEEEVMLRLIEIQAENK